jgi:hypothetical protein
MSWIDPAEIQEFGPPTVENLQRTWAVTHLTACLNYAGVTIMLYEMLLTMQMEVCLTVELITATMFSRLTFYI